MYSVHPNEQTLIFLASLGVGFLLGCLYEFLRAIRMSFFRGKWLVVVFDLLYFFMVAFFSYIFILASNKGEVRSYIIIGELLGAIFYYFSLGVAVIKFTDFIVALLKSFYSFVYKIISFPFRVFKKLFGRFISEFQHFFKKSAKFFEKFSKKVLPKGRMYVYNLLGVLYAGSIESRKGGKANGEGEKEKST